MARATANPTLTSATLGGALKKGLFPAGKPSVVTVVGPEGLLRNEALQLLAAHVLGDADSPDLITIQGSAGSAEVEREALGQFFGESKTRSLFGGAKMVVLRNADTVAGRQKKAFKEWLASPPVDVVAVVEAESLPADIQRELAKVGAVVTCGGFGRQRGEPPARFATRRATERGKRLGSTEAEHLVGILGDSLQGIDHAVEMLCLLCGEEPRITLDHVEALFRSGREGSIWSFGDSLVEGEVRTALSEASRCFAEGIPDRAGSRKVTRNESTITLRLLSAFARAALRTLTVRRQLDRGVHREEVSFGPGRPPFPSAKRQIVGLARRRPLRDLEAMVVFAEETERALKSGGATGRTAISRLATAVGMLR